MRAGRTARSWKTPGQNQSNPSSDASAAETTASRNLKKCYKATCQSRAEPGLSGYPLIVSCLFWDDELAPLPNTPLNRFTGVPSSQESPSAVGRFSNRPSELTKISAEQPRPASSSCGHSTFVFHVGGQLLFNPKAEISSLLIAHALMWNVGLICHICPGHFD